MWESGLSRRSLEGAYGWVAAPVASEVDPNRAINVASARDGAEVLGGSENRAFGIYVGRHTAELVVGGGRRTGAGFGTKFVQGWAGAGPQRAEVCGLAVDAGGSEDSNVRTACVTANGWSPIRSISLLEEAEVPNELPVVRLLGAQLSGRALCIRDARLAQAC